MTTEYKLFLKGFDWRPLSREDALGKDRVACAVCNYEVLHTHERFMEYVLELKRFLKKRLLAKGV